MRSASGRQCKVKMNSGRFEFVIFAVVYMRPGRNSSLRPVQIQKQEILRAI